MLGIGQLVLCIEVLLQVWAHFSLKSTDKISEEAKKLWNYFENLSSVFNGEGGKKSSLEII